MDFLEEFKDGFTFKQWLAIRDLTLEEFASKVGVSYQTTLFWKSGKFKPSFKYIEKIEEVLGTDFKKIKF